MLSSRIVRLISDHWAEITDRVIQRIRHDAKLLELGKLPEADLRERSREILQNLDKWLVSREDEVAERYERLGRVRYHETVPLHEIVYALQIVKENMIQYVHDQGFAVNTLDVYAEEQFERGADRIFGAMIYYVVRGYERAMKLAAKAA
jgi:hypothetical protein